MTDKQAPLFDPAFREKFDALVQWRRDVRRFRTDPVDPAHVDQLVAQACLSPSVGNCQPWRFVLVEDPAMRAAVRDNFKRSNAEALSAYAEGRAALYARLKLAGLDDAPVQLAVFADPETPYGHGLGRRSMPEMLEYSVVGAVQTLWLAARTRGLGVGWVSILDPKPMNAALDAPKPWRLIAYLCIGYPMEEHTDPELERAGWQDRVDPAAFLFRR
ncbi:MAG: 5,6-dimethylbenzimidazole synthase [Rhodospirillaceae bacterium]|jgi:5,6-dimethylbenzimidazole synthase|nr:5,6-dimethylbenzimidazole synthase [Rhodospirillaceae bacterium]